MFLNRSTDLSGKINKKGKKKMAAEDYTGMEPWVNGSLMGNWTGNMLMYEDDSNDTSIEAAGSGGSFNGSSALNATRYMNITADLDIRYALPLYGYIMPFLVVVTIIANTLIVLVLSKKHMRTPTNLVLMAMALSDMLTLLFPAPWLLYLYTFGNHHRPLRPLSACYAYNYMNEVVPALFHTASIWLTLALAIQRYIYVCHPPLARTWCTMERLVTALRVLTLLGHDILITHTQTRNRPLTGSSCQPKIIRLMLIPRTAPSLCSLSLFRVKKAVVWIYVLALVHQFPRLFDQVSRRKYPQTFVCITSSVVCFAYYKEGVRPKGIQGQLVGEPCLQPKTLFHSIGLKLRNLHT